jgi:putative ABC transport system substrate-binding protein
MFSRVIDRRRLIQGSLAFAGLSLVPGCSIPIGPWAQRARTSRIAYLANGSLTSAAPNREAFRQGLRDLGYVEDRDFVLETRYADGRDELLPDLAAELVRLDPDVILTSATPAIRAFAQVTSVIPVVFATAPPDPVAEGLVASLARPGGNMTGLTLYASEEHAKRLQLFTQAFPGVSRIGVLWTPSGAGASYLRETEVAAQTLGVEVLPLELRSPDELETILDGAILGRAGGLVTTAGPVFVFLAPRIVAWAAEHRLPGMYATSPFVGDGGLMVYAANVLENYRRAAIYVDKILKGAKPGDIPVEKPTRFEFSINLKTAGALGLSIPPSILQQATEVIQ